MLILALETILFKEVDTSTIAVLEKTAISCYDTLFVSGYRQPCSTDTTSLSCLDTLLDKHCSIPPVICGDSSWLHSTHTLSAGIAVLDFCESRNLYQLIDIPTCHDAT